MSNIWANVLIPIYPIIAQHQKYLKDISHSSNPDLALSSKAHCHVYQSPCKSTKNDTTSCHIRSLQSSSPLLSFCSPQRVSISLNVSLRMRSSLPFDSPVTIPSDFERVWAASCLYKFMDWNRSSRMKRTSSDEALSSMTGDFDASSQICPAQFQV